METILVRTKAELQNAIENKVDEIIVVGSFADKLKKTKKIALLSKVSLAIIMVLAGVGMGTAPLTSGASLYFATAPVAAITGMEVAAIITAVAIGITLIIAVFKNYDEISFEKGKMILRRKNGA